VSSPFAQVKNDRRPRHGAGRSVRAGALVGALAAALLSGTAFAAFNNSTSASMSVTTKRIFPGARVDPAHKLDDVSSGSVVTKDDTVAYPDAIIHLTGNWASAFSSTRYSRFDFDNPLPAGVPVSSATFDFRIIPNASGDTACYYFEVHRISDGSLLGTHFSSGSPQCVTGATYSTISTSLSEVTTSDIANDMYVKVFQRESNSRGIKIDMATVTLTMFSTTETLFAMAYTDAATGTGTNGPMLGLDVAGDGLTYTDANNWPTAYSTKYLKLTFPAYLPSGATITNVTFDRSYKSAGTQSICYGFEVYSGATLIGTHGSISSNISCATNSGFVTDHTTLSEVTAVSDANQIVIRVYMKASASQKSIDDLDTLTITYYLD
jgi:hypothetical protein